MVGAGITIELWSKQELASGLTRHSRTLQSMVSGEVREHEMMRDHTTFCIGGPTDIFILPEGMEDVRKIVKYARRTEIPYLVIGNGSNLLVSDSGFRGIVIKIGREMSKVEFEGELVKAEAGISLSRLSRMAAEHELSGLEYGVGIPGNLGGAVVMNAGSGGQDTSQVFVCAKIMDARGSITELGKNDLCFEYRSSRLRNSNEIVLAATLELQRHEQSNIRDKMKSLMEKRKQTTPLGHLSAGSIFRNPKDDFAGRLIEVAGCKGMRVGDAQVSDLHANWILNLGQARASDVLELVSRIQDAVSKEFGIQLELELSVVS